MMAPETTEAAMRSLKGPIGEAVAFMKRVNFSATHSLASVGVMGPKVRPPRGAKVSALVRFAVRARALRLRRHPRDRVRWRAIVFPESSNRAKSPRDPRESGVCRFVHRAP